MGRDQTEHPSQRPWISTMCRLASKDDFAEIAVSSESRRVPSCSSTDPQSLQIVRTGTAASWLQRHGTNALIDSSRCALPCSVNASSVRYTVGGQYQVHLLAVFPKFYTRSWVFHMSATRLEYHFVAQPLSFSQMPLLTLTY